jgi:hypothetical protein
MQKAGILLVMDVLTLVEYKVSHLTAQQFALEQMQSSTLVRHCQKRIYFQ